jgi:hypothetical protein
MPIPANLRSTVEHFSSYDPQTQILWIDPTSEADPLGQVPEMDQGVFALINYPDHGVLQRIPEPSPIQNNVMYLAHVQLQRDGTGTADVEVAYAGSKNTARHYFYRGRSQDQIMKAFENRVSQFANTTSFRKAAITGIEDSRQQINEKFSFSGDFSTATVGDSWFFQPLFLSGMDTPERGARPRQLPLDIGSPDQNTYEYTIVLPPGMKVDRIPDKTQLKSEFGELAIEYAATGNSLRATETFSFTQSRIPPEKYPAFREYVNGILRLEKQRLRVVKIDP